MSPDAQRERPAARRPTGTLQPSSERALRALRALDTGRYRDAAAHIDAGTDVSPLEAAWRLFLRGALAVEQGHLAAAVPLLEAAADDAHAAAADCTSNSDSGAMRLVALALEKAGWVYRHQERPNEAYKAHMRAYDVRSRHGSFEEQWESARSLGLAADLRGDSVDAQHWYRSAAAIGASAADAPELRQAVAWTNLSASLTTGGLHGQAIEAARTAQQWWHRHDIGGFAAARAELNLGYALLRQGESAHGSNPHGAREALDEAIERLTSSREALLAFGPEGIADARWSAEQLDFARRLRDTLEV